MHARARFLLTVSLLVLAAPTILSAAPPLAKRPETLRPVTLDLLEQALERRGANFGAAESPGSGESIASTFSACGSWAELSPDQKTFNQYNHVMVYDSARDRMLIFANSFYSNGTIEVWALTLGTSPTLTQIATQGATANWPYQSYGTAGIYDSVRDRVVLCGGYLYPGGGTFTVAQLSLSGTPTWSDVSPAGDRPPWVAFHSAIYDPARDRMVIFAGRNTLPRTDVWVMSFSGTPAWTQLTPSGSVPFPRAHHSAVYDGPRDRMVVFGGWDSVSVNRNDTWALSLSGSGAWTQITPSGGPPNARDSHTAITDVPRNRMLVFGGQDGQGNRLTDLWSLSYTNPITWEHLNPSGSVSAPFDAFASVYDPVRQRMISSFADEFWELTNLNGAGAWAQLNVPGLAPLPREGAVTIYDAPLHRMLVFGGLITETATAARDLWSFSMTDGSWTRIMSSGESPPGRFYASGIYDPAGDRMILFGGTGDQGSLNDAWELSSLTGTPTWSPLTPSGTPPAIRYAHTAILDTPRNRMIVYGGSDNGGILKSDVWSLSLAGGTAWSQLAPSGGPAPARQFHTAVFDAPRDRMLVFGGNSTVWALALAGSPAWSTVDAGGTAPPTMIGHQAAFDPARDRMLVSLTGTYALTLSGTPTWGQVGSPAPVYGGRPSGSSIYDTGNDRWVIFGGNYFGGGTNNQVVALSFPAAYPLNLAASPVAGGTVQVDPGGSCQLAGAVVTLTAVPSASYVFTGWSGDASGTTNPLSVTMDSARNITANFDNYTLNMTVSPPGSGGVSRNPNLPYYPPNSSVTLTAIPRTGYAFTGWSGDASGGNNPLTVTMSSSKNITANFLGYALTVTASPAGAGTISRSPDQTTYAPGSQVTLTAAGSPGFGFTGWSGEVSGATNPVVVTINGSTSVTATFAATPPACGTWAIAGPVGPGARNAASAAWDPVRHRMLLFGGWDGAYWNDVWQLTTSGAGAWSQLSPAGGPPSARMGAAMVYDPVRDRMLVFGGVSPFVGANSEVWALSLGSTPGWTRITPDSTPPLRRFAASMIYDPPRDRLIVYGGYNSTPKNDVWELSLSGTPTWTQLLPSGPTIQGRVEHSAFYDPVRDRMIVFGGGFSDVWTLSLSGPPAWSMLAVGGTPASNDAVAMVYDPIRDRAICTGGGVEQASVLSFKYQPFWAPLHAGASSMGTRSVHVAIYEPDHDLVVVFGGNEALDYPMRYDLAGGYSVDVGAVNGTVDVDACYEPGSTATLVAVPAENYTFDHWSGDATGTGNQLALTMNAHKTVIANFTAAPQAACGAWSTIPSVTTPSARVGASSVWDPVRHRMLFFGGYDGAFRNDVWELTPGVGWTPITTNGTPPSGRDLACMVYDPALDRVLVVSGNAASPPNDVWQLAISQSPPVWTQLVPTGTPPAGGYAFTGIFDTPRNRVILFGGYRSGQGQNDVWSLTVGGTPAWSQLSPAGARPAPRWGQAAIYDPVRERLLIHGGVNGGTAYSDTWSLSLGGSPTWAELTPSGAAPQRLNAGAVYDPVRDRMVVIAGNGQTTTPDVSALSLTAQGAWVGIAPGGPALTPRYLPAAVYDPDHDLVALFGGQLIGGPLINDTRRLDCAGGGWVQVEEPPLAFALERIHPNPNPGPVDITYALPRAARVKLGIFDLAGRRVSRLVDGVLPAGRHHAKWDGRAGGASATSGIYFVRFETPEGSWVRRVALVR